MIEEQSFIIFVVLVCTMFFIYIFSIRQIYQIIQKFLDYWCEITMKISMLEKILDEDNVGGNTT